VKHHSEWFGGRTTGAWERFYKDLDPLEVKFCQKWQADQEWMSRVPPFDKGEAIWHMHPVVFLNALMTKDKVIIFPLEVKPENDPGKKWGDTHNWRAEKRRNAATMDYPRGSGRKHAARDLYTEPYTPVVAICPGVVLDVGDFYNQTHQITVHHKAIDGREFVVRYGEVNPNTIKVKKGEKVTQGQKLGETGKLMSTNRNGSTRPTVILNNTVVYMLHFELFSGKEGMNIMKPLTDRTESIYKRRSDILDPVELLIEGYNNTFNYQNSLNDRKNIKSLVTSWKGKDFIKGWERLELMAYNDSKNYCTIAYGHLIERRKCENITLPDDFRNGITQKKANKLFDDDILKFENAVKKAIKVNLYQHEFDALVSLLFNCGENFFYNNKAPNLIKKINSEQYELAAAEFLDIINDGERGLIKRRRAEYEMFLKEVYDSTH